MSTSTKYVLKRINDTSTYICMGNNKLVMLPIVFSFITYSLKSTYTLLGDKKKINKNHLIVLLYKYIKTIDRLTIGKKNLVIIY